MTPEERAQAVKRERNRLRSERWRRAHGIGSLAASAKRGDSRHQIIYRARGRHLCCVSRDLPKERAAIAKTADAAQIGMNSSARWAAIEETTNTQRFEEESWLGDLDSNQD
jgi:hypothetical protein